MSTDVLDWTDADPGQRRPGAGNGGRPAYDWTPLLDELRERPGQWAIVRGRRVASNWSGHLRRAIRLSGEEALFDVAISTTTDPTGKKWFTTHARYVGEAS